MISLPTVSSRNGCVQENSNAAFKMASFVRSDLLGFASGSGKLASTELLALEEDMPDRPIKLSDTPLLFKQAQACRVMR